MVVCLYDNLSHYSTIYETINEKRESPNFTQHVILFFLSFLSAVSGLLRDFRQYTSNIGDMQRVHVMYL